MILSSASGLKRLSQTWPYTSRSGSVSESGSAFMRVTANINLFDPDTDADPDVDGIVFSDAYVRLI